MARELVLISFDPDASVRDKELASSNARSHAARVCHSLRRNRSQPGRLNDKGNIPKARKRQRVRKLGSITLERDLCGSWKAENIGCSIDGAPGQTIVQAILKTDHTSESTSNSRPRTSKERLGQRSGLRKQYKGKLQRCREKPTRGVRSELAASTCVEIYESAPKEQWALTRVNKRMEMVISRDRAGFRSDPFSTYPVRFQRSVPEALDYCEYR